MGKIRTFKFIDHWVGIVFCNILGIINLFSFKKPCPLNEIKSICIIKCFGIGSIILQQPLIHTLKQNFPDAKIIFVTFKENQKILELFGQCDEAFLIDSHSVFTIFLSFIRFIFFMAKKDIDVIIDLEFFSKFTTMLVFFTNAKTRMGFYLPSFWRKSIYNDLHYFNTAKHILQTYQGFAFKLGIEDKEIHIPQITLGLDKALIAEKLGVKLGDNNYNIVSINVNASDLVLGRRWDKKEFAALIELIFKQYSNSKFFLTGTIAERAYTEECYQLLPDDVKKNSMNIAGILNLEEFLTFLKYSSVFITNDSGPLHMAFAVGTPTFSIWGPGDPQMYGQHEGIHDYVYLDWPCSPCMYIYRTVPGEFCDSEFPCIKGIYSTMVFQKLTDFIKKEGIFV